MNFCLKVERKNALVVLKKKSLILCKSLTMVNAQVASGGKLPMKPMACNRSHIPKVLEHPTGLPNLQPSHEPPTPGPQQELVRHKPNGSVEKNTYIFQK